MPSFDIVSETNIQEVDNAINQASKEALQRYDFKGIKITLELDKIKQEIRMSADAESRMDALFDIVSSKLMKRGIELSSLDLGKREQAGGMTIRQTIKVKQGIEAEKAKQIVKLIKEMKLKVEASIQEQQVRVSGKKIDDLQAVISLLKEKSSTIELPLQFINMRA